MSKPSVLAVAWRLAPSIKSAILSDSDTDIIEFVLSKEERVVQLCMPEPSGPDGSFKRTACEINSSNTTTASSIS